MFVKGVLAKMPAKLLHKVNYTLQLGESKIDMNMLLGKQIRLSHTGRIFCVSCEKQTKKSFGQGFCYSCFTTAPEAAECIINPERCRAHLGEGRNPEWERNHHLQPHFVYLSLTNEVKVGVTRSTQIPTRWIDQGATKAIVIAQVPYRQLAGLIEVELKKYFPDKTNWQRMLKNEVTLFSSPEDRKAEALSHLPIKLKQYGKAENELTVIDYPVLEYPTKVTSINFEKMPVIEGNLRGIKGQYLLFDNGRVFNVRNSSGFEIDFFVL